MSTTITGPKYGGFLQFNYTFGNSFRTFSGTFQDLSGNADALPVGSAAGQVNKAWVTEVTIATGVPLLIDLSSLTDESGAALSFTAAIEAIKIANRSTVAGEDLTVGGGTNGLFAALPFALTATSRGDSVLLVATPLTIDGTHKILQLAVAAGTAVTVRITLLGR